MRYRIELRMIHDSSALCWLVDFAKVVVGPSMGVTRMYVGVFHKLMPEVLSGEE
jgi:hypothetical protein